MGNVHSKKTCGEPGLVPTLWAAVVVEEGAGFLEAQYMG
jgi:hypothetical protein